jgi:hypothetical protein
VHSIHFVSENDIKSGGRSRGEGEGVTPTKRISKRRRGGRKADELQKKGSRRALTANRKIPTKEGKHCT